MDYRKFLGETDEPRVLPYFGGTRVDAEDRPLRVKGDDSIEPGWWRFKIHGRNARPLEPADPPDLSALPAVRGHALAGYLFSSGAEVDRFALEPEIEPEPLAPCLGRRWYGGELLLDAVEFEDEAEMQVRDALAELAPIDSIKGAAPSLRAAYAYAVVRAVAAELDMGVSPRESSPAVADVCSRGRAAAVEIADRLLERREEHRLRLAARRARPGLRHRRGGARPDAVLEAAGARMIRSRRTGPDTLEVTFTFMGEMFQSVVASDTLQVIDAGICLSGADSALTLDSLPSAIREAIETHQLCITWR